MSTDRIIGLLLLSFGVPGLVLSLFLGSAVLAYSCLTLTFWGFLFILVLPGKYVKSEVLDCVSGSSLCTVDQILAESNLQGKAVYVPVLKEKCLPHGTGVRNEFVYVPKRNVDIEKAIEQAYMRKSEGLRLVPPGLGLTDHMEKESKTSFHKQDLSLLIESLPTIMAHDLEIAGDLKISLRENEVHAKIEKPVCEDMCKRVSKMQHMCPHIGCPLCSSIACALTRAANRPVTIEKCTLKNGTIETIFHIMRN